YAHEFWTQYWGEMLLVEGQRVTEAMVAFGQVLALIRAEALGPDPSLGKKIDAALRATGRYTSAKVRKLTQEAGKMRLNPTSCARIDSQARDLDISPDDRRRIQIVLKEQRSRPLKNQKLIADLEQRCKSLIAALDAERSQPIVPYPDKGGW